MGCCILLYFGKRVSKISIKNDLVLNYIESLADGTRVSVRELSAKLQVSEGTAYKAVKEAEQRGLVVVKPKAGTVRIVTEQPVFENAILATDVVRLLGLGILAGRDQLNRQIRKLIICDGSEENMQSQLKGQQAGNCLCLCGDRPELQTAILEAGANLLLTSGSKASWMQMNQAERSGLLILSSPQSAYSLVRLFDAEFADRSDFSGSGHVAAWMQTPDYLYYNDIIADWQRLYLESSMVKQYPVVDDELALYGGLDVWKAASAIPSQKVRSMVAEESRMMVVRAEDSLTEVAKQFILNNESMAAVVDEKQVQGIITSNDLLRYYMYTEPNTYEYAADSFLSRDAEVSDANTAVYHIRIPDAELKNIGHIEMDLLLSAAASLLRQAGCESFKLESGTFFAPKHIVSSEGLILTCRIQSSSRNNFAIEAEINDDTATYAKAILIASALERGEE